VRGGRLTMRVMFGITLAIVAVGLAYFMVVGLLNR
jgi:hypothetical protein